MQATQHSISTLSFHLPFCMSLLFSLHSIPTHFHLYPFLSILLHCPNHPILSQQGPCTIVAERLLSAITEHHFSGRNASVTLTHGIHQVQSPITLAPFPKHENTCSAYLKQRKGGPEGKTTLSSSNGYVEQSDAIVPASCLAASYY